MIRVITAATAGFCFGVQRAVDKVYEETGSGKKHVYTYGPIIHNEQVVEYLSSKGVRILHSEEELEALTEGTVIIRSHGAPERICEICRSRGLEVVDATCPFVKKIHGIVRRENEKGRRVIIVGDPQHPEVQGIRGWGRDDSAVIGSTGDFLSLGIPKTEKLSLVAQTTFNYEKLKTIIENIEKLEYDIECFNTVCNATQERQEEAGKIASVVDAMIVIGGSNSSNTRKLYEICKTRCKETLFIQTADDLVGKNLHSVNSVGITAGASTPKYIIEEVQNHVRSQF